LVRVGVLLAVCLPCVVLAATRWLSPEPAAPSAHHALGSPTHAPVSWPTQAAAPLGTWAALGVSPPVPTEHACHAAPRLLPSRHDPVVCALGGNARPVVAPLEGAVAAPVFPWASARTPAAQRALLRVFLN
jgi:hypothetical protein